MVDSRSALWLIYPDYAAYLDILILKVNAIIIINVVYNFTVIMHALLNIISLLWYTMLCLGILYLKLLLVIIMKFISSNYASSGECLFTFMTSKAAREHTLWEVNGSCYMIVIQLCTDYASSAKYLFTLMIHNAACLGNLAS